MKIGLEVHVALPTKSKLFCACNNGESDLPNTNICPICMGFPGSKPMLNRAAVSSALGIAKALKCSVAGTISFVRKVYFYPDLPKSYQITQMEGAIGHGGSLKIEGKSIRIRRIQIEEDPAQLIREGALTLIDFNRSGTPLVEIVTEPDINSEEELRSFIASLRSILYYLGVDINREIKADLNISISEVRVEVKNVTGIKSLTEAARFEIMRQEELLKNKMEIARETRGYNEKSRSTESLREKETDEEYGYIYEPDLTSFSTAGIQFKEAVFIGEVSKELAEGTGINPKTISEMTLLDRNTLSIISRLRGRYSMRSIIHGIQRMKKYAPEEEDEAATERIIRLVEEGKEVTKEMVQDAVAGREINVNYSAVGSEAMAAMVEKFLKENPEMLSEYRRNRKTANLIISRIAKENRLNPKDVAKKVGEILDQYGHTSS